MSLINVQVNIKSCCMIFEAFNRYTVLSKRNSTRQVIWHQAKSTYMYFSQLEFDQLINLYIVNVLLENGTFIWRRYLWWWMPAKFKHLPSNYFLQTQQPYPDGRPMINSSGFDWEMWPCVSTHGTGYPSLECFNSN